jgi:hypothetical protein
MKKTLNIDKKSRNQDELLLKEWHLLLKARLAVAWEKEDLVPELEAKIEQVNNELNTNK